MEPPIVPPPSTGQHFERNDASRGSSQQMGNSGNPSSNHQVFNLYAYPGATPRDDHRRRSSPDEQANHYGPGRPPQHRFELATPTGASNNSATRYLRASKVRTAIIAVIVAIVIILSVALSITLTENARPSKENSSDAQDSTSLSLSSASPSQTSAIASTTASPTTSSTGSSGTSATATSRQTPSAGDILTTVSVPTDDSRYSTFITWTCAWGCPGKSCTVDTDCGVQVISYLSISRELTCDFEEKTCA